MNYTSAKPYFYGTGRRKFSIARVRLVPGSGDISINGRNIDDYFGLETLKADRPSALSLLPAPTEQVRHCLHSCRRRC